MLATEAKFLTTREVASLYRTTAQTIVRWQREGRLPRAVRAGRRLLFDATEIHARLDEQLKAREEQ